MATITERKSTAKNGAGKTTFRAQVRVRTTDGRKIRISETFTRRAAAEKWAKQMEDQSDRHGVDIRRSDAPETMSDLIESYLKDMHGRLNPSKLGCLRVIKDLPFGEVTCTSLTPKDITDLGRQLSERTTFRNGQTVPISPATVLTYISNLSTVLDIAEATYGVEMPVYVLERGKKALEKLDLIARSEKRDRRPTLEEIEKLLSHFSDPDTASECAPMAKVILFQIFSTRRSSETTRLRWSDYRPTEKRVLVRKMKHPKKKLHNDVWVSLPDRAIAIIESMPRTSEFIFPFNHESISTAFERACTKLGIEDLTYHDLRHEGISHLFEQGLLAPEVMKVSGHTSMQTVERYNHFDRRGDKYSDWPWLDRVIKPETEEEARAFAKTRRLAARRKAQMAARDQRANAGKLPPKSLTKS